MPALWGADMERRWRHIRRNYLTSPRPRLESYGLLTSNHQLGMITKEYTWALMLLLMASAIIIRAPFVLKSFAVPDAAPCCGDAHSRYYPIAHNLLQGYGFSLDREPPYRPDSFNTPGYTLFLAAIYLPTNESRIAVVIVQVCLEMLTLLLIFQTCRELNLPRLAQTISVALGLLCPFLAVFATDLMTEMPATFAVTLACWALIKAVKVNDLKMWVLSGSAGGLCLLVRPDLLISVALLITAAFICLIGRKRNQNGWVGFLLLILSMVVVLTPWTVRGYFLFGSVKPLGEVAAQTHSGYATWLTTWADSPRHVHHYWWPVQGQMKLTKDFPADKIPDPMERQRAGEAYLIAEQRGTFEGEPSDIFLRLADEASQRNPVRTRFIVPLRRTVNTWLFMPYYTQTNKVILALAFLFWAFLSVFSFSGVALALWQKQRLMLIPIALILGRLPLPFFSAVGSEARYFLEALPACYIFAALALAQALTLLTSRSKRFV